MSIAELIATVITTPDLPGASVCRAPRDLRRLQRPPGRQSLRRHLRPGGPHLRRRCPVLGNCRRWVTGLPMNQRPYGVTAGLDPARPVIRRLNAPPAATVPVIAMRTNGAYVNAGRGPAAAGAVLHTLAFVEQRNRLFPLRRRVRQVLRHTPISVDARARMDHMRNDFPTPDGVVGLVTVACGVRLRDVTARRRCHRDRS